MTITEFLLARIAEDEAVARAATPSPWVMGVKRAGSPGRWRGIEAQCVLADRSSLGIDSYEAVADSESRADVEHIARHDPARVLAECEAKRRIVELSWDHFGEDDYGWGMEEAKRQVLVLLALPYAHHPGYDEAWRL